MHQYSGVCHCGSVAFVFTTDAAISKGTRCTCSYCRRQGMIHSDKLPLEALQILRGEESISVYLFADKVVRHSFCRQCGVYLFYTGSQCKVNLNCVEQVDTSALTIKVYDGKHLL